MPSETAAPTSPDRETRLGVDWAAYCRLRDDPANDHLRMTYFDGTLVMSPQLSHDHGSRRLLYLVTEVARAWRVRFLAVGTTTLRREGRGPLAPAGKEPDEGFYLGATVAAIVGKLHLDLAIDPPPDLAIEVDNTGDSGLSFAAYARIGVPEVWTYRVRDDSLRFFRLDAGHYAEVGRSLALPRLTPPLVLEVLRAGRVGLMDDLDFHDWLQAWARNLPGPPA